MSSSDNSRPAQPRLTKPPLGQRALRSIGWVLAGLVVLMLIWAGAQVALRRPRPTLLFTEADLPKLPPPDENGWQIVKNEIPSIGEPQRPDKEITEISDGKATFDGRWSRAEGRAQKIADVARDEKTKRWLALIDKAAARPRFADACPMTFEPDCPRPLHLLALHQMQEATVLDDALSQRWNDAFSRVVKMVHVDTEFLPSARSTLTLAVARAEVHRTVKLVDILLDGAAHEKEQGRGPDGAQLIRFARDIEPLFEKVHDEDMEPMRVVIAEYLFSVYAIEHLTDSAQGRLSRGSSILYDPNHTLEMLNERFEKYVAFARSDGAGEAPKFPSNRLWFLRNPYGHLLLEVTRGTLENHVPTMRKDRDLLMQDLGALHKRLKALMN